MNNIIVDSNIHKNTKVCSGHGNQFGENIHFVPVIADELRSLILEYPCCLLKDNQTGQFGLHALLGFEPGENLFLTADGWSSHYIPLHIRRQPFMVGLIGESSLPASADNTVLTIDMNSKRVIEGDTADNAHALFDENQQPTDYLTAMSKMVFGLSQGILRTEKFIQTLADNDLIEAIQLGVTINTKLTAASPSASQQGVDSTLATQKVNFDGLYVINEKKLACLSDALLEQFHQNGYLQACHLMMASMGQIQHLITLRNSANHA
ncbi:SapC family protein [Shewanella sp. 5_MG-2023]|uniref:SapC family protein n=1 Tax=Shewanella sp. 5_MG-2023 TaxID=3062656 RepID=UPI0026E123BF|nr:SapC family protein [Shewanella sp. 5_MG-2023]MDO6641666.1 SapC family protein [Shewanella sp. 5_MG-2023]